MQRREDGRTLDAYQRRKLKRLVLLVFTLNKHPRAEKHLRSLFYDPAWNSMQLGGGGTHVHVGVHAHTITEVNHFQQNDVFRQIQQLHADQEPLEVPHPTPPHPKHRRVTAGL